MTTRKKIESNQKNAQSSTGPRSAWGKGISRRNSLKHGFYAREFVFSENEKPEAETLRRCLFEQLAPKTALQRVAFEQVFCCCWRCKLAARTEAQLLNSHFSDPEREAPPLETGTVENPAVRQWYGTNRQTLREGIRFLSQLEQDIQSSGYLREEWNDGITKGWGLEFLEDLTKWKTMSHDAVLLANQLVTHAENFKMPLPANLEDAGKNVVIDPQQGEEMVLKLIRQQRRTWRKSNASPISTRTLP